MSDEMMRLDDTGVMVPMTDAEIAEHNAISAPVGFPQPKVIPKLELYRRMTDEEFEMMRQGVATQSARIQDIFNRVDNFVETDTLWPLLVQMGDQLFGPDRRAELLAPM